jgi:hypothetical protein
MNNLKRKKTLNLIASDPQINDIKMKYPNRKAMFWYQSVYNQSKENIAALQEELQAKGLRQQIKIDLLQKIADAVEKPSPPSVPVFDMTGGDTPRISSSVQVQTYDPIERMREEPKPLPQEQEQEEKALTDVPDDETEGELDTELEPEEEIEEAKPSKKEEEEEEEEEEAKPQKKKEEKKITSIKEFEDFNKKNSAIHQEIINEMISKTYFDIGEYPISYNLVDWKNNPNIINGMPLLRNVIDNMRKETLKKQKTLADDTESDNINNKLKVLNFLKKRYKEIHDKVKKPVSGAASSGM